MSDKLKKDALPYFLVIPMATMMVIVIIYPILKTIGMSFFKNYLAQPGDNPFVGITNYIKLFEDRNFINSISVTIRYVVVTVVVRFVLGLLIALLLNHDVKGRGIARSLIIIPWAMPTVVVCLVFVQMFDYQYGIVNHTLTAIGIIKEPIKWMSDKDLALPIAMFVSIWKGTPWAAIMLLAGLQGIPKELYEAAQIDGANTFKKFWYVTLPMLKPISLTVSLLLIIWTIKSFGIIYVLNKGGPAHATEHMSVYIYHKAFEGLRMGVASAAGVTMLAVTMIFTIVYLRLLDRVGDE